MDRPTFSWRDPRFTYADLLTASRLVMLPYLLYAVARRLDRVAVITLVVIIVTDLIDGRIARRMGQARTFGAALDSTIDFVIIYSLFTTLFATGVLAWWKWLVIMAPAVLMAWTQITSFLRATEVALAPAAVGKLVGQIQFAYLPFLLVRAFWIDAAWAQIVDHAIFAVLAVATAANTVDHARTLRQLLSKPGTQPVIH